MKKIIAVLLCILAVLSLLCSCGNKDKTAKSTENAGNSGKPKRVSAETHKICLDNGEGQNLVWQYIETKKGYLKIEEPPIEPVDGVENTDNQTIYLVTAKKPGDVTVEFTLRDVTGGVTSTATYQFIIDEQLHFTTIRTGGDYYRGTDDMDELPEEDITINDSDSSKQ